MMIFADAVVLEFADCAGAPGATGATPDIVDPLCPLPPHPAMPQHKMIAIAEPARRISNPRKKLVF
jgi:hypothetical protein